MNRTRILGVAILICGIAVNFTFDTELTDITGAVFIGLGIGVLLAGQVKRI